MIALFLSERNVLKEGHCPLVRDMYMENVLKWELFQNFASITFNSSFGGRCAICEQQGIPVLCSVQN